MVAAIKGCSVAEREYGHQQLVRHNAPWTERDWVTTAEGRQAHIGQELRCLACKRIDCQWLHPAYEFVVSIVGRNIVSSCRITLSVCTQLRSFLFRVRQRNAPSASEARVMK